ncbi:hypothetical protein CHARACLAT_029228 [Characodon lateralis]|uniref:Uncharacterized protein n=1 Tax=Characodon lateralis TaxID=208331 RepID=A0ABU7DVC4_9TELE|nr:hypothetical protein [Characodon lateralis]
MACGCGSITLQNPFHTSGTPEATPGLALCLAVTPSWRGASAELLLPTTSWSPSIDDTHGPVSPIRSHWLSFY